MDAIYHGKNRYRQYTVDIFESDGTTPVVLLDGDVIRYKAYRGDVCYLEINSYEVQSGGSTLTYTPNTNDVVLTIGADETASLQAGAYDGELIVLRDDIPYHVEHSVFFLNPTGGGDIGTENSSSSSSGSSSSSS